MKTDTEMKYSGVCEMATSWGEQAWQALSAEKGVGLSVWTLDGVARFLSAGECELFGLDPSHAGENSNLDLNGAFPVDWAAERLHMLRHAHHENRTTRIRTIWHGRQLISLVTPVPASDTPDATAVCVVFTHPVAGVLEDNGETIFSRFIQLGDLDRLSPRELEVISLIGRGLPTRLIAEHLGLSPKTVEKHRDAIVRKLGEKSRIRLATMAVIAGLTPEDSRRQRV